MKTSPFHRTRSRPLCRLILLTLGCVTMVLRADQVPNPTVTASARPFNASFSAANLFDTAGNTEYASLTQGAVSAPFTTNPNDGTWVEMDFGSTVEFDRFVLRTRANNVDVIGQSRLIVSSDPVFDSSDRIFTFEPTGANGAGPVRNLNELVSGRYARWEVITRTGSGLNLGGEQMWFLKTPAGHSLLPPPVVINSSPQFNASFAPANAVNGDFGIEYASLGAQGSMFIDFDFGASISITGFEFLNRWADRVTTFDLILANTPDFASPVATQSFTADANGNFVNTVIFQAATLAARYVRLQATGFSGANNTGVREIQFFTVATLPPTITQNPVGGTRLAGDAFILLASAIGDIPLTFQWLRNGTPVAGATNSTLIFTNLQASNSGNYEIVVSNPNGSTTSAPPAALTVLDPPLDITSGLRLHLKFDETAGPVAIDDSGNARDGTLQGFPGDDSQWVAGRIDGAIAFNANAATDEVVLVPDDGGLDFSTSLEFSLSAWVNGSPVQQAGAPVFAKGTGGGGEQFTLDVPNGAYRFYVRNAAAGALVFQSTNRPNDTWQHVAVVYSALLNRVKFYVNGVETLSGTPSPTLLQNTHDVSIGSRKGGAGPDYNLNFNGRIDDARIYGRVLTPADVTALYNQASLIPPSIVSAPSNTTLFALETAALIVVADGSPPLSYQWFKDGLSITNATNATLVLNNVTTNDAGSYSVRVSNTRGVTNSVPAIISVVDPAPDLATGLILHLNLDETAGVNAVDSSGLNHDGLLQGFSDTPWTTGILGGALAFNPDGSAGDDVVLVTEDGTFDFASSMEFTLSAWANGNPVQEAGGPIICKGTGGGGEQFAIDVFQGYRFYGWTGVPAAPVYLIGSGGGPGPDNTWQHVVGVFSRSLNRVKLYINGVEVASTTPPATIVQNTHEVSIGSRQGAAGPYDLNFNGSIDDVRIYNRPITPREIKSLNEMGNRPRLSIVRAGGSVTISWPATAFIYTLESSDVLPGTTWNPVPGVVNNSVTLSASDPAKFYRLRRQ